MDGRPAGGAAYAIPDDNPYVGNPDAMPEIWLTGLRNPWRIRFDGETGNLWIGDVGQGAWEEIDVAPAGVGGLNFGWNRMEGFHCYEPTEGCDETGLTLPVAEYGHGLGCAVIGGVVVRDADQPRLNGGYVFADECSGNVWLLDPSDTTARQRAGAGPRRRAGPSARSASTRTAPCSRPTSGSASSSRSPLDPEERLADARPSAVIRLQGVATPGGLLP